MFKLLKHDIKDSYFEVLILNGILIGLSLVVLVSAKFDLGGLLSIAITAFILVFGAISFVMIRAIIKNFHTKLFTDNGYLTLTTPVSIDKILISKIIVSLLHVLTTIISFVICIVIVSSAILDTNLFKYFFTEETWIYFSANAFDVIASIIYALSYILYAIVTLLFVLILSNTGRLKKQKVLKGILIYIGLAVLMSQISPIRLTSSGWVNFIINVILSVGFYFAGRYLIVHKLELE